MAENYVHKPINNFEDADKALYFLGKVESLIAKKEAVMNSRIQTIRDKFDVETAQARTKKDLIEKEIKSFLWNNKHEFIKQRTKSLVHGVIGWRTGTPKVLLLNRKYNTKTVLELAKKLFKARYVRQKEELAKDVIIADFSKEEIDDNKLASMGLRIDKGEKEVIDINWESLEK